MGAAEQELYAELRRRGIDEAVVEAMARVPRSLFAPLDRGEPDRVWSDEPFPLPERQSISQPLVVGRMVQLLALQGGERVLDVGAGSGWHAAVLAQMAGHVWAVERHASLVAFAQANLARAGVDNVTVLHGDGTRGYAAAAPYRAINVAAGARRDIPIALEDQLDEGGRLVAPVDDRLVLVRRQHGRLHRDLLESVRFVPLVGAS
jgi:protein-L-isoaspartate(D-aspartate) O-methyltransferase